VLRWLIHGWWAVVVSCKLPVEADVGRRECCERSFKKKLENELIASAWSTGNVRLSGWRREHEILIFGDALTETHLFEDMRSLI
jgi:hypothetical protein